MLYNQDWNRKPNPISEVLLKAAGLLEKYGHTKGVRINSLGEMCLLGALEVAQGGVVVLGYRVVLGDTELTMKAVEAINIAAGLGTWRPIAGYTTDPRAVAVAWNNAHVRTGQEVIDVMRKAAEAVEKENANVV